MYVATEVRKHYNHRALQVWTGCYYCPCITKLIASCKRIRIPESVKFFVCGIRGNTESRLLMESGIQYPESRIPGKKSKFPDCLGFPFIGWRKPFRLTLRWFLYPLSGLPFSLWQCAKVVWNDISEIVYSYILAVVKYPKIAGSQGSSQIPLTGKWLSLQLSIISEVAICSKKFL